MPPSRTNTGIEAKTVPLPVVEDMSGMMTLLRSSREPRIVHHSVRRKSEAEDLGGGEEDEKCLRIVCKDEVAQRVYLCAADDA